MGSLIDYKGKIAVLSATADAPDQNFWIEGMKDGPEGSESTTRWSWSTWSTATTTRRRA